MPSNLQLPLLPAHQQNQAQQGSGRTGLPGGAAAATGAGDHEKGLQPADGDQQLPALPPNLLPAYQQPAEHQAQHAQGSLPLLAAAAAVSEAATDEVTILKAQNAALSAMLAQWNSACSTLKMAVAGAARAVDVDVDEAWQWAMLIAG